MLAEAGTATRRAYGAQLAMLAVARAIAHLALTALLVMLADAGTATVLACGALLAMLAVAGAVAIPAMLAPLVVRTSLVDAPFDWMRRRVDRHCRNCWCCLIHGDEL